MIFATGEAAVYQLKAADLDDAVAKGCGEAGGFCVEDYLSHGCLLKLLLALSCRSPSSGRVRQR
jgi:hypothetical protein